MKDTRKNNVKSTKPTANQIAFDYEADLQRMRDKAKEFAGRGSELGLVMADALIRGMRDIGYKNTAYSLFELIDNAIQAGAQKVCIEFRTDGGPDITEVAVLDDGHGIPSQWLQYAIRWGGTHREHDRSGFGRYGYGMKSASISFGRRLEVLSRTEEEKNWSKVYLDLDEIAAGGFRDKDGNLVAPSPETVTLSGWIQKASSERFGTMEHGNVVLVTKVDKERLTYSKLPKLKEFVLQQIGVTYRNFLRSVDISVDGIKVEPIDPLFLTPGFKFYNEDEDRADALPPLVLDVKTADKKEIAGHVRVRFSYMPPTFLRVPEDKPKADGRGARQNSRFKIRRDNNGIIFTRAARQIDVVDSKCPWLKFQNNDRYIGIEVDFDPILDEEFKITTSKQQVIPTDRIWDILEQNGVKDAINAMRARWEKENKGRQKEVEDQQKITPASARPSEEAMKSAERYMPGPTDVVAMEQAKKGEIKLEQEAKKTAEAIGLPVEQVKQQLKIEAQGRPYRVRFEDVPGGPFYRVEQFGGQKRLFINRAHKFFTDLYAHEETKPHVRYGLEAFLFVLGTSELTSKKELQLFYETERVRWSSMLNAALSYLAEWDGSEDATQLEQEVGPIESQSAATGG